MHVLLTGGAGFIGTNLRKELERSPRVTAITILDDFSSGLESNVSDLGKKSTFVNGSILNTDLISPLVAQADCIVHLAARPSVARSIDDPEATTLANVSGTINILEQIRQSGLQKHFIFASSSSVYGANKKLPKSERDVCFPISPYAASKLAAETYALAYQSSFRFPVTAFRFFNVYGPYQQPNHAYAAVIPAFLYSALRNEPIPVHGDGLQTRDFTYVETLTAVVTESIEKTITFPSAINLAFGTRSSLRDLIKEMSSLFDRELLVDYLPSRPGDVRDSQADNSLLRQLFPDIDPIPLSKGLAITKSWLEESC